MTDKPAADDGLPEEIERVLGLLAEYTHGLVDDTATISRDEMSGTVVHM